MRLLLDHNAPTGLRKILAHHEDRSAYEMSWAGLANGELLDAAEQAGIDILITGDRGLRHRQRLKGRRTAVVVLGTTHWPTLRTEPWRICDAVSAALPAIAAGAAVDRALTGRASPRKLLRLDREAAAAAASRPKRGGSA